MYRWTRLLAVLGLIVGGAASAAPRQTVFAAASLTDAMKAIDQAWADQGHPRIRLSFAASSTLARQLEHGAHADIFASADDEWMNWASSSTAMIPKSAHDDG